MKSIGLGAVVAVVKQVFSNIATVVRLPIWLVSFLWRQLFGSLSWSAPFWMRKLGEWSGAAWRAIKARPVKAALGLIAFIVLSIGGILGYAWWKNLPHPVEVTFRVSAPTRTEIEATEEAARAPKPLTISFSESVAALAASGKEVGSGVTLAPEHPGKWIWKDDRTLRFTPSEDWPIGKKFSVSFEKALFKPEVKLKEYDAKFHTPNFKIQISNKQFYQDPINPSLKKIIVELNFSHPVNPVELNKRIEMSLAGQSGGLLGIGKKTISFVVSYDALKLNAYIHSEPLDIPKDSSTLVFTLGKGTTAARGSDGYDEELTHSLDIPGLYSLQIDDVRPQVVTNDRNEPEQVLVLHSTQSVNENDMHKAVSVWVLPKTNPTPQNHNSKQPYHWRAAEVSAGLLEKSARLTPEAIPSEFDHTQVHSYKYHADVGAQLFVQVEKGIKSFGGYMLGDKVVRVVTVPPFPAELKILSKGALLALSGEKKVAVLVRDLPGVKVEIGRVLPNQLQHLVSQADGDYANPEFYGRFGQDNLIERFERKVPLSKLQHGKAHYEAVDMAEYLKSDGGGERRGVFLMTVSSYDPAQDQNAKQLQQKIKQLQRQSVQSGNADASGDGDSGDSKTGDGAVGDNEVSDGGMGDGEAEGDCGDECEEAPQAAVSPQMQNRSDKRLVLVTDLGILVKKSLDGTQDVFVQSIYTGRPVEGANVEVIAKNGTTLFSKATDASGRASFAKIDNLTRERTPLMIIVKKSGDLSFMPLNRSERGLDVSRFDVGGASNARSVDQVSAYLFSDRGIYRPGDTFHIGMIVKSASWSGNMAGLPLEAEVLDARGLTIKREKVKLSDDGFIELSHSTQESSPTGTYNINLYLVKDGRKGAQIGTTSIKVQEFQPDRMKASAHFSAETTGLNDGWVHPKDLKALVNVQNLFGTPAENRQVRAELTLSPAYPSFRGLADYKFYDPQRAKEGYNEALTAQTTNAKGDAEFDLQLSRYAQATYRVHFLAHAFELEGGRSVAAECAVLVSDMDYLLGYKADGALNYVSRGSKREVSLIAINPQVKKTKVDGLTLQLVERKFVSVLSKQSNDTYKYESRKKEVLLKESKLSIPAAGYNLALATDTPGNFAYVLRNDKGMELSRIEYAVAGNGNVTRNLERNSELQLTLNKADFAPGEEIEISVNAPYTGAGLITIERDKVYATQWFKSSTLASVQKIKVPKNFEGNGYISVQYIRDPGSDEIFMSPLSHGVVPFATSLSARTNKLKLTAPDMVKPGQMLKIKLSAEKRTRAVIFAVDEGVLQVARYQVPDPLAMFFQKRMLEVQTSQILDLILPEFKKLLEASAPGGDAEAALGKNLNPFKRKRDKPVVYWSGIVEVSGEKEFSYQVPDYFNGTMRIMAVAVNEQSVGVAQTKSLVRGDFVISPNVPMAVTPGDEFDVSVGVANNVTNSGANATVLLTLKTTPHLQVVGNETQPLKISEMREASATFHVKVADGDKAQLGSASLNFMASMGDKSSKLATDISVRPSSPRFTQVTLGNFTGSTEVEIKRNMYAEHRHLEAGVSGLPLVLTSGLSIYLANFQHLCTEQLVSQAMPALILDKLPEFGKGNLKTQVARTLEETLRILRTRQNGEGGFGLWTASVQADEFASVYAIHMMMEAHERGDAVPADMLQKGVAYLQTLATSPSDNLWGLRTRSYAAYLLTRQTVVTTPILASLRETLEKRYPKEWQADLAGAYLAASYQLLKQERLASDLIDKSVELLVKRGSRFSFEHYYDPLIRDAQTLYLLSRHFPDRAKTLPVSVMAAMVKPIADGEFNTLSSAYLILAFDAYASMNNPAGLGKLSIASIDANGKQTPLVLPDNLIPRVAFGPEIRKLRFGNDANITTYYAVTETGYDKKPQTAELRNGMEVLREYVDAHGNKVEKVNVGDEVTVKLKFRAVDRTYISTVALIDLLPGGFEPVLDTPSEPASMQADGNNGEDGGGSPNRRTALAGLAGAKSSWSIEYADVREDRVVFYGALSKDVGEISYRIKATNAGHFVIPPAYAESLYERNVQARSVGAQSMDVIAAEKK